MNIYLDIDGVLVDDRLTENNGKLTPHALELLKYVTDNYDCFWLTTHCRGGENRAVEYLRPKMPKDALPMLQKIKPTNWMTYKTEAIDFTQDFRWLDDDVFPPEMTDLAAYGRKGDLILVDLRKNPDQLQDIINSLPKL